VGPIFAQAKLQSTVALSTAEAEFASVAEAVRKVKALRDLITELGFACPQPTVIQNDNQSCIAISKSKLSGSKTRHVMVRFHFVREAVQQHEVALEYCPTEVMVADMLTKALPKERFEQLRDRLLGGM
jgi:hypothetical protein